ncbi:hypothetical protein SK128_018757 [Halocaridina rubra]|uniref:Uncharacterized protein n=1 Tax=Halocaridina rubra TaxID=373956 RepID=A0AAN9FV29_HALRR
MTVGIFSYMISFAITTALVSIPLKNGGNRERLHENNASVFHFSNNLTEENLISIPIVFAYTGPEKRKEKMQNTELEELNLIIVYRLLVTSPGSSSHVLQWVNEEMTIRVSETQ